MAIVIDATKRESIHDLIPSLSTQVKVLIVDDMEDVRWALSNVLRMEGFVPPEIVNLVVA